MVARKHKIQGSVVRVPSTKVRVTPEGSREVDPLTIMSSPSILSHLREVAKAFVKKPVTTR